MEFFGKKLDSQRFVTPSASPSPAASRGNDGKERKSECEPGECDIVGSIWLRQ